MSKNKLFAGAIALAFVLVAVTVSAAYTFPTTITTKQDKMNVQTVLNMATGSTLTVDGVFGPATTKAVKAFQKSKGLTADGKIGPMTRAALEAAQVGTTTTTTTTTTTVAGCPAGALFNSMTGASCATVTTVAGCTAGAAFNSITGAACVGTTTTTSTTLTGGAGDATIAKSSVDVESDISSGKTDVKAAGFTVKADGSDINLTSVKVSLVNNNTASSSRIERYFSNVSVYLGSTKVGSAVVADFTKDGTTYTKSIALTGATIKQGDKPYVYVTVSTISHFDSTDASNEAWNISVPEVRFADATGMTLTSTPTNPITFVPNFVNLASSGDVQLTASKGSANPIAQNVKVSDTGSTSDVLMNEFKIKATGSDLTLNKLRLNINGVGALPSDITGEIKIKAAGNQIASTNNLATGTAVVGTTLAGNGDYIFTFDNDLIIPADTTVTFDVYAKINKIYAVGTAGQNFNQGDSLNVSLVNSSTYPIYAEDAAGDAVTTGNISGTSTGEYQTFYSKGINASNFTSSYSTLSNTGGTVSKQTFNISFSLTAFGNSYYIPKVLSQVATGATIPVDGSKGLTFNVLTSAGTDATGLATASPSSLSSSASTSGSRFELDDGYTKTFNATIELAKGAGTAGFYRIQLGQVEYDLVSNGTSGTAYTFAPAQNFQTSDVKVD